MTELYSDTLDAGEDMSHTIHPKQQDVALWRAVIIQAVKDALGKDRGGQKIIDAARSKKDAERWFYEAGRDFKQVCAYADLSPERVQFAVLNFLTSPTPDPDIFRAL